MCSMGSLGPKLLHADSEDSDQTDGCPDRSVSSLVAQSLCWFCHVPAQLIFPIFTYNHSFHVIAALKTFLSVSVSLWSEKINEP